MNDSQETDFKIGDWWVRPRRNELERGEEAVCVEGRSMAVLVCLARHAPKVVSRERLLEEVWADSPYIGDEVVNHSIWELRKALGDSARDPSYIKTIPRKGYLLLQEVLRPQGAPLPMAGVRIDHYDIQEELGSGSMGVVYKAVDRRLGRTVAIKFLAPELTRDHEARRRFQREARLAASLDHPNLATVHQIGETQDGYQYLVTAFYPGGSLRDRLACGTFSVEESLDLARQLAAGLGAAHQRGIVHRDIKPANLLLDDHGTLKIADFGIAKLQTSTQLTRTGASLGTPAYKSPEQAEGLDVDHRTDLWSLGVVLFELLTGRRPFAGEYELAVVHSILSKEPEPLEDRAGQPLPAEVRRIVGKAMAKDREQRYQSAEELIRDLNGSAAGTGQRPAKGPAVKRLSTLAAWLLILAAVVSLVLLSSRLRPPTAPQSPVSTEAPQREPDSVELHQAKGSWLIGNDQHSLGEVERLLTTALEKEPRSSEVLATLAMFYAERFAMHGIPANSSRAATYSNHALALDPENALARSARARLSLERKYYAEAERLANEARDFEPRCSRGDSCDFAFVTLGETLWKTGREEEALQVLEEGAQQGGGFIRCVLKKAQLYEWSSLYEDAVQAYREVLGVASTQTTAQNDLGILLYRLGRFNESADILRPLFAQTNDPHVAVNLGNSLYGQKAWSEAILYYLKADELHRQAGELVPQPLMNIGDVFLEQGNPGEAREYFDRAADIFEQILRTRSLSSRSLSHFAICLAKAGRREEARSTIQEILRQNDLTPELLGNAAQVFAAMGDKVRLMEVARQALEAGLGTNELMLDPAFLGFRDDADYRQLLKLPVVASP